MIDYMENLEKHLYIEFRYGDVPNGDKMLFENSWKNKLWEEHGIIKNLDSYIDVIYNIIEKQIKQFQLIHNNDGTSEFNCHFIITEKDFKFQTFFDTININVYLNINFNEDECTLGGSYLSLKSGYIKGKIYHVEIGNISASGEPLIILKHIRKYIAHELTHAYDDFCRRQNNKTNDIFNQQKKTGQYIATSMATNVDCVESEYENKIGRFLYFINNVEINAYIGSLKEELIPLIKGINNSSDAWQAVQQTDVYKNIEECTTTFNFLNDLDKNTDDNVIKIEILNLFNKTREKDFFDFKYVKGGAHDTPASTYHKFFKIVEKKYRRFLNRFLTQSSKIVYDLYKVYGDKGIDSEMTMKYN